MNTDIDIVLLSVAPATAYREFLYRPHSPFARWVGGRFEVVARPGQPIGQALQEGDVLLEVTLGHMSPGRCVTLAGGDFERVASWLRLPYGQLVLRPRRHVEMSEALPVEPSAYGILAASGQPTSTIEATNADETPMVAPNKLLVTAASWEAIPAGATEVQVTGTPTVNAPEPDAMRAVELEEEQLVDKPCSGVIGSDDRVAVTRAWDTPHRWICQISARRRRSGKILNGPVGTGVLIAPRFVLTAAHLLWDSEKDDRNQWVDSEAEYVLVTPARNDDAPAGSKAPFGQYEAHRWNFPAGWKPRSADAWKYDYALIELKEPAGAKRASILNNDLLCFWGSRECGGNTDLEVLAASELDHKAAYTGGYPYDLGHGTRPYTTSGMLADVDIRGRHEIMSYTADACPGQSGSPIWIELVGKRILVGVLTKTGTGHDASSGLVTHNSAVRITQEVFDQISRWLEAARETPWLREADGAGEDRLDAWSQLSKDEEQPLTSGLDSSAEEERGDGSEVMQLEDDEAEAEQHHDQPAVDAERDVPSTSVIPVAIGQRVELDLTKTPHGATLDRVRWEIPGRVVRGYEATTRDARLVELTPADLERSAVSFFWVDAGQSRTVRARIRTKSGAENEFVAVFDVEGPTLNEFSGTPGVTRIVRAHGTLQMQFGNPYDVPGVNWTWKITMPAQHAGFVQDIQTVVADRAKTQLRAPDGKDTRMLVWRHPSNSKPHVQLDPGKANPPCYTDGLSEIKFEAGWPVDTGGGTSDSPGIGLLSLDRTVSVNDQFTYHLMFRPKTDKPEDSIWVPIAQATWSWHATAVHSDGKWSLPKPKMPKMKPRVEMATPEFPLYQSNASENEWQVVSAASVHELFEQEFAEARSTEAPEDEGGAAPEAYDMPIDGEDTAPWAAGIGPFPPSPTLAFYVNEPAMVSAFTPVTTSAVNHLCFALVDLTGNPLMPPYAAHNDTDMVFVGSMLKVCAMYAAFALRARVQAFVDAAAAARAPVVPPSITDELQKAWKPKLQAAFPTRPGESFGNKQDITFPKLDRIFTFLPSGRVEFAHATPALTNADLDRAGEFGSPPGKFHDWMRLMMRWSNNTAASYCILALGYFYINAALAETDFFDAANGSGLWLSADYAKHDWVTTLVEKNANAAGQPLTARWATAQKRRRSNITATAAQTARLMTLIAQDKLVDATASREMRALMQSSIECVPDGACGIGSYVKDALDGVRRFDSLAAKKGYGDDKFSHECAIVERTVDGKQLRYVVVGLGSAPALKRRDLSEVFRRLDHAILTRNA